MYSEGQSGPAQISKMEFFEKTVNGQKRCWLVLQKILSENHLHCKSIDWFLYVGNTGT